MNLKGKLGSYLSKIQNDSGEFEILQLFEQTLDTSHPERGEIPIKLLGFGEISIVFEILTPATQGLAFKRLPLFDTQSQVERHIAAYEEYREILTEKVGLNIPFQDTAWVYMNDDRTKIALYCIQAKINPDTVMNKQISNITVEDLRQKILPILEELFKIWNFNLTNAEEIEIGIDGQISNWAEIPDGFDASNTFPKSHLVYLDTSTPLYRKKGVEAMEAPLFMKSAPSFLRWMLKSLVDEVVNRYYNIRDVLTDLIANFYKEQRPDLIPTLLEIINTFLSTQMASFHIQPLSVREIKKYYQHDKFIWMLYYNLRRFDRFLKTKIQRQKYDFYLPETIKR